jgi:hypothetical protein
VNRTTLAWGLAFATLGVVILAGWVPGASGWAIGPRIGLGTFLAVTGVVFLVGSFAGLIRARTAAVDGKGGGCPVGATCPCGQFNFKPRGTCRQCGAATMYAAV